MVELRKRPAPSAPVSTARKKAATKKSKSKSKMEAGSSKPSDSVLGSAQSPPDKDVSVSTPLDASSIDTTFIADDTLKLTTDEQTSLAALLSSLSTPYLVIFTYPRASTPGCTTQACAFRDSAPEFPDTTIFGLSRDSPKANAKFKAAQGLGYELLSDEGGEFVKKLGMEKQGGGVVRGVVVLDREGRVKLWFQGGPVATVDQVKAFLKV